MDRRGGGYHDFPSNSFCLNVPKNFVGEHFGVSGNFGYRKILSIREGGGITFLRRKLFVTQYRKISLGNTSVYREISGIEKFYASEREAVSHFSVENFLSHSTEKCRWGILRCIRKFWISNYFFASERKREREREREKERQRGGGSITFLRRKLFVSQFR